MRLLAATLAPNVVGAVFASKQMSNIPTQARYLVSKAFQQNPKALVIRKMKTMGETMADRTYKLCIWNQDEDDKEEDLPGLVCSYRGCDDPNATIPNLMIECNIDNEVCIEEEGDLFCVNNTEIDMSISLDFKEKSKGESFLPSQ